MTTEATQAPTETQAAPEAVPAAVIETDAYVPTTVDERLAALKADDQPAEAEAKPEQPPQVDEVSKAREERAARLKALQEREREAHAKRLAKKQQEQQRAPEPDPKLQQRMAELESFEKALADEDAFLSLAEQRGIKPEKLGAWIRDRLQNPERIAAETAKKALSPVEERMKAEISELRQQLLQLSQAREMESMQAAEMQAGRMLLERTGNTQRVAPLAHAYLQRHGEEAYLQFARSVASSLPEGSGLEAIHDSIEATLESLQLGTPSAPSQPKPTTSAPARATTNTVTNSLASKQTARVDDETAFALLPLEERMRILKERHK